MKMALHDVKPPIDYINPHATATPIGDLKEIEAICELFGAKAPPFDYVWFTPRVVRGDPCARFSR